MEKRTLSEKKNVNGEQNERLGHYILSIIKHHHCDFCKMTAEVNIREKEWKWVNILYVRKLRNNATIPCRDIYDAAGYDLSLAEDVGIPWKEKIIMKTELVIAIPEGTYTRIAPQSGLAVRQFTDVGAGVVDADYHGKPGVVLFNHADDSFRVHQGNRIA